MSSNEKVSNVQGDRKEAGVTKPLSENKSSTKDAEKGTDELADMLLTEKKSSKKDVEKGIDEFADTLFSEKKYLRRMLIKVPTNWQIRY